MTTTLLSTHEIAGEVARRVADPATLAEAVAAARSQTTLPVHLPWRDHTVAAGYAGTALLFAAADAVLPGKGWDAAGHGHLAAACSAFQVLPYAGTSLFGGLAGLGFVATRLDRGRGRYGRLLSAVDRALLPRVARAVRALDGVRGCGVGAFDLISGLSGAGVHLLSRRRVPEVAECLKLLLVGLTRLLDDQGEPRRWHTPAHLVAGPMSEAYPGGAHNCGLAHGLPAPLAFLSIAAREGVTVNGMSAAVETAADWLVRHRVAAPWGPDWPTAVALDAGAVPFDSGPAHAHARDGRAHGRVSPGGVSPGAIVDGQGVPGRAAWCYGAPGVARALWLAGEAIGDDGWRELAVQAMLSALARPRHLRGLSGPGFCHGTAGLLQITRRFAADTGRPEFTRAADALVAELLDAYEPGSLLGYRNVEPGGVLVDHPGLLDGAPGVALTLLDVPAAPAWDRMFLLG
jgi:lantibiotic biosynthesis protein